MPPKSGYPPDFSSFATDPPQIQMIGHEFVPEPELQPAVAYATRLRLETRDGSGKGHVFVNGKYFNYDDVSRYHVLTIPCV